MAQQDFFPQRPALTPQIYAYSDPRFLGQLKVEEFISFLHGLAYDTVVSRREYEEMYFVNEN